MPSHGLAVAVVEPMAPIRVRTGVGRRRWIVGAAAVAVAVPATAYGYLAWNTKDSPDRAQLAPPISTASTPPVSRSTVDSADARESA